MILPLKWIRLILNHQLIIISASVIIIYFLFVRLEILFMLRSLYQKIKRFALNATNSVQNELNFKFEILRLIANCLKICITVAIKRYVCVNDCISSYTRVKCHCLCICARDVYIDIYIQHRNLYYYTAVIEK